MMNTKITLDKEEVRRFVGDFNKLFKDLEEWTSNAVQIETWKNHFLKMYPKIFNVSTENEVEMETTMETESRPIVDREEKLRKVEEKLLTLNRPGFLESSTAGGGGRNLPPCVTSLFEDQ